MSGENCSYRRVTWLARQRSDPLGDAFSADPRNQSSSTSEDVTPRGPWRRTSVLEL